MRKLTEFRTDNDYSLWLRFDDGLEGSVFLGNLLEIGAFKLWRDRDQFRRVAIDPAAGGDPTTRLRESAAAGPPTS